MERRLRVLALWLSETNTKYDGIYNGAVERKISEAIAETKKEIGDMLLEVLDLSVDGVTENLEDTDYAKEQERIVNLRK